MCRVVILKLNMHISLLFIVNQVQIMKLYAQKKFSLKSTLFKNNQYFNMFK